MAAAGDKRNHLQLKEQHLTCDFPWGLRKVGTQEVTSPAPSAALLFQGASFSNVFLLSRHS